MIMNLRRKVKTGPNVPPLGWVDMCLYLLGMLLSGGLTLGPLAAIVGYWDRVCALVAPEALCTAAPSDWFLLLAAVLLPGSLC